MGKYIGFLRFQEVLLDVFKSKLVENRFSNLKNNPIIFQLPLYWPNFEQAKASEKALTSKSRKPRASKFKSEQDLHPTSNSKHSNSTKVSITFPIA